MHAHGQIAKSIQVVIASEHAENRAGPPVVTFQNADPVQFAKRQRTVSIEPVHRTTVRRRHFETDQVVTGKNGNRNEAQEGTRKGPGIRT